MKQKRTTVMSQVFKVLEKQVEVGGKVQFDLIKRQSENGATQFISEFRQDYAYLIAYPFKDSTVNRYIEVFIKSNKDRFSN